MAPLLTSHTLLERASSADLVTLQRRHLSKGAKIGIGVGVGVGVFALLVLIGLIILCVTMAKKRKSPKASEPLPETPPTRQPMEMHQTQAVEPVAVPTSRHQQQYAEVDQSSNQRLAAAPTLGAPNPYRV